MRWQARKPELVWRQEFETRLGATVARLPRLLCWLVLAAAYAGLAAVLYVPVLPVLDVVSPLTGHLIGLGLAATAGLLIRRRVISILITGTALTILGHALPAYLPDRSSLAMAPVAQAGAGSGGGAGIQVLALNAWQKNRDPDLLVRVITHSGADVVLLSEVTAVLDDHIERLRQSYPFAVYCPVRTACTELLLSKLPLGTTGALPATIDRPGMVWAELAGAGPHAGITVVGTHLYRPSRGWFRHARQLDGLIAGLGEIKGPLILGGDLNVSTWTRSFQSLIRRAGLQGAGRALPSWPAHPVPLPQFGLDHILVRGSLVMREFGLGDYAGSDHLPVRARIEVSGMARGAAF